MPTAPLAFLPVDRASTLVRHREHCNHRGRNLVMDGVGKASKNEVAHPFWVDGPRGGVFSQAVDRREDLRAECIRGDGATFKVPEEGFPDLFFREWKERDLVAHHRAFNRAFESSQGTAWTEPSRRAWRRFRTSSRHASEMEGSELPSKLSSSAATSAERSLSGSSRASCRRWSTRAFMRESLALAQCAVHP